MHARTILIAKILYLCHRHVGISISSIWLA